MVDPQDHDPAPPATDRLIELIQTAGRREVPPALAYQRTLAVATAVWERTVHRRRRRRWVAGLAAAIFVASSTLFIMRVAPLRAAPPIGRIDRVIGVLELRAADGSWNPMNEPALELRVRDRVRTGDGDGAGIVMANGNSLRIAEATDLVFESPTRVLLLAGKVYVDTGMPTDIVSEPDRANANSIEVVTPLAVATDVGTQFEVLYRVDRYRLRVREGRVRLRHSAGLIDSDAGAQLSIVAGAVTQGSVGPDGADWEWVQQLAPSPQIDGNTLSALLAWVARETGRTVRFATPAVQRKAHNTILHGNIRLLAPLDALSVMLATTDIEHVLIDEHTILIKLAQ